MGLHTAYFDASVKPTPRGTLGIGGVIFDHDRLVLEIADYDTNLWTVNEGEYAALCVVVSALRSLGARCVTIYGDSQLVVRQVRGEYMVRNPILEQIRQLIYDDLRRIPEWSIHHVPREQNKLADALSRRERPENRRS